jgi:5-methyltetrahydrofolate--homocysteine methyltransferase
MNARGVAVPVLLGGAALTRSYAENDLASLYKGPLFYCKDAFEGLHTMDRIAGGESDQMLEEQQAEVTRRKALREKAAATRIPPKDLPARSDVARDNPVPVPPFWGRRVVTGIPLEQVFPLINPLALFRGQWGFKRGAMSEEEFERSTEEKARPVFEALQQRAIKEKLLEPKVVYGYFPVQSRGDDLIVYHVEEFKNTNGAGKPGGTPREWLRFSFPRQEARRRLCISDFFRDVESGQYDVLGVQLVTVGERASEIAQELFKSNKYQEYLYLHGFGVESAEGLAELWHKRMRQELGFGCDDSPKLKEIWQQGYRGSRYSFGYPACPNLEDRAKIVELLAPQEIGVTLSENFMLVPEQSTDAIVVHHPQAKYFDT